MTETVLAVDVGGTKLATARVDRAGVLQSRAERPTPVTTDPDVVWAALAEAIDEAVGKAGGKAGGGAIGGTPGDPPIHAVGVGTGGPMPPPPRDGSSTTVAPPDIPARRGLPPGR